MLHGGFKTIQRLLPRTSSGSRPVGSTTVGATAGHTPYGRRGRPCGLGGPQSHVTAIRAIEFSSFYKTVFGNQRASLLSFV